jgi:hypothetical protein
MNLTTVSAFLMNYNYLSAQAQLILFPYFKFQLNRNLRNELKVDVNGVILSQIIYLF